MDADAESDAREPVFVARPLLDVLLELADDSDPQPLSVALATEPAGSLVPSAARAVESTPLADLPKEQPVYAEFFLPNTGRSVENVFGVNLSTPPGRTRGRFVTHPDGDPSLDVTDDLSVRVLVATPPYTVEDVRAFDRSGRRLALVVVAADAPEEELA